MEHSTPRSSFHLIDADLQPQSSTLLDQQCSCIISSKEPLELAPLESNLPQISLFNLLIFSFYNRLLNNCEKSQQSQNSLSKNLSAHHIKTSLFKLISQALQKKLFLSHNNQKYYEEMTYSLAFKNSLTPFLISILSENTNFIPLERLNSFYRTVTSEQYHLYLPIQLYYLYGGSLFTIEAKTFKEKIINLTEALGKVLSISDTVPSRNIELYKSHKERKIVLEESVKIVMLSKNKENLLEIANALTFSIFNGKEYLNKQDFLHQIQYKSRQHILNIFVLLLRSEFVLFQQKNIQNNLGSRAQTNQTNFYANQMTKLFNKCPFNGDERCSCKKCQCVRRNRESAKLNQEKKRNAVEQVDLLKKKIEQLEEKQTENQKKIRQLEQENLMLKVLLNEIKQNPSMKSIMRQTLEPISKILNNQL